MAAHEHLTPGTDTESSRRFGLPPGGQRLRNLLLGSGGDDSAPGDRRRAAWLGDERGSTGEDVIPRFPLVRHGYDCAAVDACVAELERDISELDQELVGLRARLGAPDDVTSELKRIGEQTSSVLIAAHKQHEEILRAAREEANRSVAEARANASTIMAEAESQVRELEATSEAAQRQRDRLLEDARTVSTELAALVDAAQERIPAHAPGG